MSGIIKPSLLFISCDMTVHFSLIFRGDVRWYLAQSLATQENINVITITEIYFLIMLMYYSTQIH